MAHYLFSAMLGINKPYRSQSEASALLGREVVHGGTMWRVVEYNDLGVLYWQVHDKNGKPKGKQFYNPEFDRKIGA